ncbi:MAG: Lipoprotein releasing system transrane protein LolC, partial [Labilithrix sp.]|nr:Lipoprotein releasing system transrane protein LolC [Labilithrix sp.]
SNHEPEQQAAEAVAVGETDASAPLSSPAKAGRWSTEDVDQPWSIGEAIGVAMRAVRGHFLSLTLPVLIANFVGFLLTSVPAVIGIVTWSLDAFVPGRVKPSPFGVAPPPAVPQGALIGSIVATALLALLTITIGMSLLSESALAAVRDEPVAPGRMGRAFRRIPRLLAWQLLFLLAVGILPALVMGVPALISRLHGEPEAHGIWELAGIIPPLFIAPGYLIAFGWAPFFMVDDNASFFTAMRKSWRASKQYLGNILLYLVALAPITLLIVAPLVGVIAQAFVWLGLAYGYVRATGRNDLPWYPADFASRSIRTFLKVTLVALGLVAGTLVIWVKGLPTMRGTAWSVQDTAIRAAAILSSVAVIIVLLALLLPYMLDRLEGRRFTSFVAARHVRSQKSGFLTVISVLSICGVALSSCALSSVVSVMGGFSQDLKRKILGNNAHIVIDTTAATPWGDYERTLDAVRKVPGVTGATPVVHGEVMASSASNLAGVMVTGVDPKSINEVIELNHNIEVGKMDYLEHPEKLAKLPPNEVIGIGPGGEQYYKGAELPSLQDDIDPDVRAVIVQKPDRPGIILGRELAKTLHVYVGDEVTLVSPLGDLGPMGIMPRTKRFRVAAIFYSGMYEYDAMSVYTMLDQAEDYFATGGNISAIDIKVDDAEGADRIAPLVIAAVDRPELRIRDWREINKNLFSALKLERFATFIILSIAILVASFCIVCTLLLMVTEKGKEIAILKAIGASDGSILRTFMIEGMIIGGIGTVFGVVTGLAMCVGLKWFGLRLDPEVYYIDRLPISVNGWDFLTVAAAALTICTLSTVYPAYAASRLRPVDGLRYE